MLILIGILVIGIVVGSLPKLPEAVYTWSEWILNIGLFGLLFFMGVRLGSYPDMMRQLKSIGLEAFVFAVCSLVGSVIVVWVIERLMFHGEGQNER
ncbi:MAG TPA: DUF340 domain-containing protein [Thermodesulforhabdus norvegica]|uniref:DUF340 domain-containing protein n=1 Tax=Thermodesulforhabdus norvegica TaxID=39841 RepID=A0A7C1B1C4_9BACT|nr:DUF340 domain-containing protein [Thermodesulforhabdus norvegica]